MQKLTSTKIKKGKVVKRGARRTNQKTVPVIKQKVNWKTFVEQWLSAFDYILVKVAVSALLVYEVIAFVTEKTQ